MNNGLKSNKSNIYTESNSSPSVDNNEDNVPDDDDSGSDSTLLRLKDVEHDEAFNFLLDCADDDSHSSDSGLDGFDYSDFGFLQARASLLGHQHDLKLHCQQTFQKFLLSSRQT